MIALCPFCGSKAEQKEYDERGGYGEYERTIKYHLVVCGGCGAEGPKKHQKWLIDFTKYTVNDFRNNPILRARVEEEYEEYCRNVKQAALVAAILRKF
jgi:hypothetical protein